jgi:hypothetical protein
MDYLPPLHKGTSACFCGLEGLGNLIQLHLLRVDFVCRNVDEVNFSMLQDIGTAIQRLLHLVATNCPKYVFGCSSIWQVHRLDAHAEFVAHVGALSVRKERGNIRCRLEH